VQPLKSSSLTLEAKKATRACCQKKFVMKICAKFNLSFGCNGAICQGSHSEATSKLQKNQTTFAILFVEQTIVRNVV